MNKNYRRPHGTYEGNNCWVTPLGEYNIIHYDCPTDDKIRKRVKDSIKEIIDESVEETDCPLCKMMKGHAYNIVYYCTIFCHNCRKAHVCTNFDPNSREEEEWMMGLNKKLDAMSEEEMEKGLGRWLDEEKQWEV